MTRLFLDDIRDPDWVGLDPREWTTVRSFFEFVAWIKENGLPEQISFDHDLGGVDEDGNEVDPRLVPTGMTCAHWLVNHCMDNELHIPKFFVHSANPVGAENIRRLLEAWSEELNQ